MSDNDIDQLVDQTVALSRELSDAEREICGRWWNEMLVRFARCVFSGEQDER